jgi:heme oxygenase (biliverdin-producing, ferredoxin)
MSVTSVNHLTFTVNMGQSQQPTLTERLKERTKGLHAAVENTTLMKDVLEGNVTKEEYSAYVAALHVIYRDLEEQLEVWSHVPCLQSFVTENFKVLFRKTALSKDLLSLGAESLIPVEGAVNYGNRLKEIARTRPHALIAHIYVRYLGDLFGGRMIKKRIEQMWPDAVALYHYTHLEGLVKSFKENLDRICLQENEIQEILEEADWAFAQHVIIFNAIKK